MGPAKTADSLYPPLLNAPGKGLDVVGVAGNILIVPRGDLGDFMVIDDIDAEDVEDALE